MMLDRREFIKFFGVTAAAVMLCPDDLLYAEPTTAIKCVQPRRILHGSKLHGCTGWNGVHEIEYPKDFA
jgi:hypothetical protein